MLAPPNSSQFTRLIKVKRPAEGLPPLVLLCDTGDRSILYQLASTTKVGASASTTNDRPLASSVKVSDFIEQLREVRDFLSFSL